MRVEDFHFGAIRVDGKLWDRDVVIDHGEVRKRRKKPSKRYRDHFGHTPVSLAEDIPWDCRRLVIGTGTRGSLPVMNEVKKEAARRGVELVIAPTAEVLEIVRRAKKDTNAILHVTC